MLDFSNYPELEFILMRDGFIIFIDGLKDDGKTDMALLLLEWCYEHGRVNNRCNIETESYMVKYLDNMPDLDEWLLTKGKKVFILDEAGTIMKRMRYMSNMNLKWMDIIQMIRKYDCGFIGCAPTSKLVDSGLLDEDIFDARIHKENRSNATVTDNLNHTTYPIETIPKTQIKFNTKWIAHFYLQKPIVIETLKDCCKCAKYYAESKSYNYVKLKMGLKSNEQIRRLIAEHCEHTIQSPITI